MLNNNLHLIKEEIIIEVVTSYNVLTGDQKIYFISNIQQNVVHNVKEKDFYKIFRNFNSYTKGSKTRKKHFTICMFI